MSYDKPYQDIDTLIKTLKSRNLIISDEVKAKAILRNYSYYDLINGYKGILMPGDMFIPGVTIEYLRDFYMLDKEIQSLCMKYSLIVETSLKCCLAVIIASRYGVHQNDYLDDDNYKSSYRNLYYSSVKTEILRSLKPKYAHQPYYVS